MRRIMALFLVTSLLMPYLAVNAETGGKQKVEIYDSFGNKITEKFISEREAQKIEREIMNGNEKAILSLIPKRMDFGVMTYVISYGRGKVYIPMHRAHSFLRFFIRPIFFKYERGITFVKFGANYRWDRCKTFGDYGYMVRNQFGVMIGFVGLHIRIPHKLTPDTHIFVGGSFAMLGKDLFL